MEIVLGLSGVGGFRYYILLHISVTSLFGSQWKIFDKIVDSTKPLSFVLWW